MYVKGERRSEPREKVRAFFADGSRHLQEKCVCVQYNTTKGSGGRKYISTTRNPEFRTRVNKCGKSTAIAKSAPKSYLGCAFDPVSFRPTNAGESESPPKKSPKIHFGARSLRSMNIAYRDFTRETISSKAKGFCVHMIWFGDTLHQ